MRDYDISISRMIIYQGEGIYYVKLVSLHAYWKDIYISTRRATRHHLARCLSGAIIQAPTKIEQRSV